VAATVKSNLPLYNESSKAKSYLENEAIQTELERSEFSVYKKHVYCGN